MTTLPMTGGLGAIMSGAYGMQRAQNGGGMLGGLNRFIQNNPAMLMSMGGAISRTGSIGQGIQEGMANFQQQALLQALRERQDEQHEWRREDRENAQSRATANQERLAAMRERLSPEEQELFDLNPQEFSRQRVLQSFKEPTSEYAPGADEKKYDFYLRLFGGDREKALRALGMTPDGSAAGEAAPKLTEQQAKYGLLYKVASEANANIEAMEKEGFNPVNSGSTFHRAASDLPLGLGGVYEATVGGINSSETREYDADMITIADSYLKAKTGQASPESEVKNTAREITPRAGDSPEVIKRKAEKRRRYIEFIGQQAGPGGLSPNAPGTDDLRERYGLE